MQHEQSSEWVMACNRKLCCHPCCAMSQRLPVTGWSTSLQLQTWNDWSCVTFAFIWVLNSLEPPSECLLLMTKRAIWLHIGYLVPGTTWLPRLAPVWRSHSRMCSCCKPQDVVTNSKFWVATQCYHSHSSHCSLPCTLSFYPNSESCLTACFLSPFPFTMILSAHTLFHFQFLSLSSQHKEAITHKTFVFAYFCKIMCQSSITISRHMN